MSEQRNQIKKLRQKYLDILRLEQTVAAGGAINSEQQAKLGRKDEVADNLAALGVDLPELPPQAAAPGAASSGGGASSSGSGGGSSSGGGAAGQLRVRCSAAPAPYSALLPHADLRAAMAGRKPLKVKSKGPAEHAAAAKGPAHQTFTVKVQVPLGPAAGMPMLVYNQSRSFQTYVMEDSGADAQRLGQLVRQRGVLGQKGYFTAWMEGDELVLNESLLFAQPW